VKSRFLAHGWVLHILLHCLWLAIGFGVRI
jgi:hypothetical protein